MKSSDINWQSLPLGSVVYDPVQGTNLIFRGFNSRTGNPKFDWRKGYQNSLSDPGTMSFGMDVCSEFKLVKKST